MLELRSKATNSTLALASLLNWIRGPVDKGSFAAARHRKAELREGYVKRSKSDAADAAAICEAVTPIDAVRADQIGRSASLAHVASNAGSFDPSAHPADQRAPGRWDLCDNWPSRPEAPHLMTSRN
jgi:hypothetical protein